MIDISYIIHTVVINVSLLPPWPEVTLLLSRVALADLSCPCLLSVPVETGLRSGARTGVAAASPVLRGALSPLARSLSACQDLGPPALPASASESHTWTQDVPAAAPFPWTCPPPPFSCKSCSAGNSLCTCESAFPEKSEMRNGRWEQGAGASN